MSLEHLQFLMTMESLREETVQFCNNIISIQMNSNSPNFVAQHYDVIYVYQIQADTGTIGSGIN